MPALIACLLVGYLCGCALTAELVARRLAHRSIFELGDGNPGMANVGHELGTKAALACLLGDILKTLLPALALHHVFPQVGWAVTTALTGLGATMGHILPFWHGFKGGKGVTTIATTIILMNPLWGVLAGVVGVATIICSGYLSIAAVAAMGFYTVAAFFTLPQVCALVSCVFLALQLVTHWSKLQGIRSGTTHRASLSTRFWAKVRGR